MIKQLSKLVLALGVAVVAMAGSSAKADFTFDSTVMSNNISGVLTLSDVDVTTPVDPMPFGADTAFASYLGTSDVDNESDLDAVFEIVFTDVDSGLSTTFQVTATGPVGQNSTAVSFFGGPTFTPSMVTFELGTTKYTISNFRSAAEGTGKAGTFAFTVNATAVPEPASMAMLAMGGLGLLGAARRRKAIA